jgi:hypothetical protein
LSDHRGAFIDIDESISMGKAIPSAQPIRQIGTKSILKELITYKEYLHHQISNRRVYDKAKKLSEEANKAETRDSDFLGRLNALDMIVTQNCMAAEKVVKLKIKMSPESYYAHQVVHYWNIKAKEKLNRIDTTIQQQAVKGGLPPEWQEYIYKNQRNPNSALRHATKLHSAIKEQQWDAKQTDIMEELKAVAACGGGTA